MDTTTTTPESRGRLLYTAYGREVDFLNYRGEPIPAFDELTEQQRQGWITGAQMIWDLAKTGTATIG
jgi:hypothetical protein